MDELTATQFELLTNVAKKRSSASEIAKETGISLPYILSQLTLLEAKGLIQKDEEKKENKPGKPKKFYSLATPRIDVSLLMEGFGAQYQIQNPTRLVQVFFRVLSFVPPDKQGAFAEYYWCKAHFFRFIKGMALIGEKDNTVELMAITTKEKLAEARKQISEHIVGIPEYKGLRIACWVHTLEEIIEGLKKNDQYYVRLVKLAKPLMDDHGEFGKIFAEVKE